VAVSSSSFLPSHTLSPPPTGHGSYGAVWKAKDRSNGQFVAIKMIPLTNDDEISSIQKEIDMLRDCSHPNIVQYHGSWKANNDSLWIVMEYCAGGSVADIMFTCDCTLPESVIAYIASETLAGLAYLHSVSKVHRDIKCGNILLTETGAVKLADFGVAAQLTNTMSKRNTFIGTPHWMAPEVIQLSQYDGKVDVWALGISCIEMAERFPPRWRVNPNRVIFQIVKDPSPKLTEKEMWSLAFQDFIAQCLLKDPKIRPATPLLQQHKFVARDRTWATKELLPMIAKSRAKLAEISVTQPLLSQTEEEQYYSWRGPTGTIARPQDTVLARHADTPSSSQYASPALQSSGTVVMRSPIDSSGYNMGSVVSHSTGELPSGTMVMRKDGQPSSSGFVQPSPDYMAAVNAVQGGPTELETVARAPPKSDIDRMIEKIHTIYSGGGVVPLPFIQAADIAPASIITGEQNAQSIVDTALKGLVAQEANQSDTQIGEAGLEQARESPVLQNIALSYSLHNKLSNEVAASQDNVPPRVRDILATKADDLSDTLRTILCL
jgi:serine/threonine protein kinase